MEVNLLEPPAWFVCAKTPEDARCETFCMDSFALVADGGKLDSECKKVCDQKRTDESYGWCVEPTGDDDAQDATDNNNTADDTGSNPTEENTDPAPEDGTE